MLCRVIEVRILAPSKARFSASDIDAYVYLSVEMSHVFALCSIHRLILYSGKVFCCFFCIRVQVFVIGSIYMHAYFHLPLIWPPPCFPLVVVVRYEQERYSVEEEDGSVTLALVLDKAVPFPVTVIVRTPSLLDSSVGDAATGELLEFCLLRNRFCFSCVEYDINFPIWLVMYLDQTLSTHKI